MLMVSDSRPLAAARIGLGLAGILNAIEMYVLLGRIASGAFAMPVFAWIPAPTQAATTGYLLLAVLAGVAITVGYQVAPAAALMTILNAGVFLWDQQTYSSHRWLAFMLVIWLIFARSETSWSVTRSRPGPVPYWPQLLMMTQLSVCYFFAAASKLNGIFLSGNDLSEWVWVAMPPWVFQPMAIGTVVLEFFLAFAFWSKRTWLSAAVLGCVLHLSIVVMMKDATWPLVAFSLTCVSLYGLYPWGRASVMEGVDTSRELFASSAAK